jgi:DNA-binding NtrC family response regulator
MRVLFLDDDSDLREAMASVLTDLAHEPVTVGSVAELKAQEERALRSKLAIIDLNLGVGAPSGVDAYRWLRSRSFAGRVAFLTGHGRSFPLVREAMKLGDPSVVNLEKPLSMDDLEALLAKAGS